MAGNTFGKVFRVTTWGESHGPALGAVIDGCPPRLPLTAADIDAVLARRRPGVQAHASNRREPDRVEILSGVLEGLTTGTPLSLIIFNRDVRSQDYDELKRCSGPAMGISPIRPNTASGPSGGRALLGPGDRGPGSRRGRGPESPGHPKHCGPGLHPGIGRGQGRLKMEEAAIWENPFACPDPEAVPAMAARVEEVRAQGDSLGGIVEIRARNCPPGLGEPVFDKLDAALAQALMSVGAVKGVEIGAGFAAARMLGSEHNDPITPQGFAANRAGGILAGISNGDEIILRAAVKPIPSIALEQDTIDLQGRPRKLRVKGRHDISAIPRIVPVLEAMVRLTLADFLLRQRAIG
jgi:chorismate synthase